MIHSGAVIAAGVSQGRSTTLGLDFRVMSANMPHTDSLHCALQSNSIKSSNNNSLFCKCNS